MRGAAGKEKAALGTANAEGGESEGRTLLAIRGELLEAMRKRLRAETDIHFLTVELLNLLTSSVEEEIV